MTTDECIANATSTYQSVVAGINSTRAAEYMNCTTDSCRSATIAAWRTDLDAANDTLMDSIGLCFSQYSTGGGDPQ